MVLGVRGPVHIINISNVARLALCRVYDLDFLKYLEEHLAIDNSVWLLFGQLTPNEEAFFVQFEQKMTECEALGAVVFALGEDGHSGDALFKELVISLGYSEVLQELRQHDQLQSPALV